MAFFSGDFIPLILFLLLLPLAPASMWCPNLFYLLEKPYYIELPTRAIKTSDQARAPRPCLNSSCRGCRAQACPMFSSVIRFFRKTWKKNLQCSYTPCGKFFFYSTSSPSNASSVPAISVIFIASTAGPVTSTRGAFQKYRASLVSTQVQGLANCATWLAACFTEVHMYLKVKMKISQVSPKCRFCFFSRNAEIIEMRLYTEWPGIFFIKLMRVKWCKV